MNHEVLKRVIYDQRQVIRNMKIMNRNYEFESQANYIIAGMRRAGNRLCCTTGRATSLKNAQIGIR